MNFSDKVYELIKKIPSGRVTTYKALARKLNTKGYQAVGNSLNKNPCPIVAPCHRVIKTDGSIGGYKNGSKKKIQLLQKEGIKTEVNSNNLSKSKIANFEKYLKKF